MDWKPGQRVAVYQHGAIEHVKLATVERLTATQVVLDNGRRFRKDGSEVGRSSRGVWSTTWTELRPVDDPQVWAARARQAVAQLVYRIGEKQRTLNGEGATLALLDYIERETAAVRAAVVKLTPEEG